MPGNLVHFEISAKDVVRAKKFYSALFGWKINDANMPGGEYYLIDNGSTQKPVPQGGGLQPAQDGTGHITVYFDVDNIEQSIEKVRELGGTADEKMPVPGQGWFAGCTDSEGNAFSLWQRDESAPMPEMSGTRQTTA